MRASPLDDIHDECPDCRGTCSAVEQPALPKKENIEMNETTTANVAQPLAVIEFDGHAQYNQAIDDACHALDAIGDSDGWATVRALREPKIPGPSLPSEGTRPEEKK